MQNIGVRKPGLPASVRLLLTTIYLVLEFQFETKYYIHLIHKHLIILYMIMYRYIIFSFRTEQKTKNIFSFS
jgi:hypothetical protein